MLIIKVSLIVLIIIIFALLLEGERECRQLKSLCIDLACDKLAENVKIAVLSDFHANLGIEKKLLAQIKEFNPDLICITGDWICSRKKDLEKNKKALELLSKIAGQYTVVFSLGNHEERLKGEGAGEYGFDEDIITLLSKIKLKLLDNAKTTLRGMDIYGISLDLSYYDRYLKQELKKDGIEALLGSCDREKFNLLLAHSPEYFKAYAEWGSDLVLSGHNHGGLIRLPLLGGVISPRLKLFPKYDEGVFKEKQSQMVLSGGLGSHTLKLRVNNYPKLIMLKLNKR